MAVGLAPEEVPRWFPALFTEIRRAAIAVRRYWRDGRGGVKAAADEGARQF